MAFADGQTGIQEEWHSHMSGLRCIFPVCKRQFGKRRQLLCAPCQFFEAHQGDFIHCHGVGAMLFSNIAEDAFQIIRNQVSEILVLPNLRNFRRPKMQIIFLAAIFINAICRTASTSLTRISAIRST